MRPLTAARRSATCGRTSRCDNEDSEDESLVEVAAVLQCCGLALGLMWIRRLALGVLAAARVLVRRMSASSAGDQAVAAPHVLKLA